MDFRLSAEQELLQRSVPEFAETEIRPHVRKWDEEQHFPSDLVPALARLGLLGEEGQGFAGAMQVLDGGRIGIAALSVGLAQGAYEAALRYSQERRAFGRTISAFQAIQWKLADNAMRIEAARLLTYRAAYFRDHGRKTTLESSMAKLYASEIAVKAADDCVQIPGGYGLVKDYQAEKFFRDVKLTTIGEGTSEIQRLVIARQLLSR